MKISYYLLLVLLASCSVGKRAKEPALSFENSYIPREDLAFVSGEDIKGWWKKFNDETLNHLIEEALSANFDLKIAIEKIEEMRAKFRFETAQLFPEIDAATGAERFKISETLADSQFLGPPYQSFFNAGFDANWEIDLFGKQGHARKAAYFEYLSQKEAARGAQVILTAEVAKYYLDLRYFQTQKALTEKMIQMQEELNHFYQDRFEAGVNSEDQALTYKVDIETTKSLLQDIEKAIADTTYYIAYLLGKTPKEFDTLMTVKPMPRAAGIIAPGIPSDLLKRRPDIKQSLYGLYAATEKAGYYFASYFPSFSLTGSWGVSSDQIGRLFKSPSINWNFFPSFALPILDFGRIRSEVKAANSSEKQALYSYEKTVLSAFREVETALSSYLQLFRKEEILLSSLNASKTLMHLAEDRANAGIASYVDYYNQAVLELENEKSYIEASYQVGSQVIAFYKAMGGGW